MKYFSRKNSKGFTLIEMIVSISIFTIVLFVAMSAFLSIINGDHKSRAMRITTDNLNLALEDMSRNIKTGTTYNCGGALGTNDCPAGTWSNTFAFTNQDGVSRTMYKMGVGPSAIVNGPGASGCGDAVFLATQGCILREDVTGISRIATSMEIDITSLRFYVSGSAPFGAGANKIQPTVVIAIEGSLGAGATLFAGNAGFKIQTTVTQRAYDN